MTRVIVRETMASAYVVLWSSEFVNCCVHLHWLQYDIPYKLYIYDCIHYKVLVAIIMVTGLISLIETHRRSTI